MLVACSNCLYILFLDLPRDCSDVRSGNDVYQIYPNTSDPNCFDVYCEIGSDGNAWTVWILGRVSTVLEQDKFEDTKGVVWSRHSKKLLLKYALQCKLSYVTFLYFPIGIVYYIS
jgi:hypothetical protein